MNFDIAETKVFSGAFFYFYFIFKYTQYENIAYQYNVCSDFFQFYLGLKIIMYPN